MSSRTMSWLGLGFWLMTVSVGYGYLVLDSTRPSMMDGQQSAWPSASALPRGEEFTLVAFLHPHCSCSRATLAEIARLMADLPSQTKVIAVFQQPTSLPDDWYATSLWRSAWEIPELAVYIDRDCRESSLFGASVSGEIHLYDARGQLRFRGGLTPSRGHEGTNAGQLAIRDLIDKGRATATDCHAYGCLLIRKDEVSR